jgi:hypothetical protein
MLEKWWRVGKDVKDTSSHGIIVVLSQHLSGVTEEDHENLRIVDVPAEIWSEHLPITKPESCL